MVSTWPPFFQHGFSSGFHHYKLDFAWSPRNWDQEGVSQFLGGADFTDIVFTTKKKGKKRYHKGPQTHLQLLFERQDFERAVERTQRNVVSHGTTRLHGERRVSLDPKLKRRVEMVDPTTPAEQPEVQPAKNGPPVAAITGCGSQRGGWRRYGGWLCRKKTCCCWRIPGPSKLMEKGTVFSSMLRKLWRMLLGGSQPPQG